MNNEKNINGIPNANNIKIQDTPAESFASIYGNGTQTAQPIQPQPIPTPQVSQPVPPIQSQVAPTPQVVQPVQAQQMPQSQPMPNQPVQPATPVQTPQMSNPQMSNPQVAQIQNQQVVQPVAPVQPQPVPNTQVIEPIQPVQVDADRLQSIEEQLSKTSQYKPEDFQQEKIDIPTTSEYEKNKSGLSFVIVLSIILGLVIFALPFISKYFG